MATGIRESKLVGLGNENGKLFVVYSKKIKEKKENYLWVIISCGYGRTCLGS